MKWGLIGAVIGAVAGAALSCIPGIGMCLGPALLAYTVTAIVAAGAVVGAAAGIGADVKLGKEAEEAKKEGDQRAEELKVATRRFDASAESFGSSSVLSEGRRRPGESARA